MNILITGASQGIGYELVKLFSNDINNVVIGLSRNSEKLKKLKLDIKSKSNNDNFHPLKFDLLQINKNEDFFYNEILKYVPSIDILINNAGLLINKSYKNFSVEEIQNIFQVNFFSAINIIKILHDILSKDSHIVNIGSMGGFQGSTKFSGLSFYSASKGALAIMTECLAEEMKETGAKINCLALGATQTEMLTKAFPEYKAPISAKDMSEFIYNFSKNGQKYFNGKVIPVSISTP